MAGSDKKQQRLQLAMGGLLILAVILIEVVSQDPTGIYVYSQKGVGPFQTGQTRDTLLGEINRVKSIRTLVLCPGGQEIRLAGRRLFEFSPELAEAGTWVCLDRKKGIYLFRFSGHQVKKILFLNEVSEVATSLFTHCQGEIHKDIEAYLRTQDQYPVFRP